MWVGGGGGWVRTHSFPHPPYWPGFSYILVRLCIISFILDCKTPTNISMANTNEESNKDAKENVAMTKVATYSDVVRTGDLKSESTTCSEEPCLEKVPYFSGNQSVEVTKGILHLYKLKYVSYIDVSIKVSRGYITLRQKYKVLGNRT